MPYKPVPRKPPYPLAYWEKVMMFLCLTVLPILIILTVLFGH